MVRLARPAALLLDIEGTMSPQSFVARTLFPYARTHLPAYVAAHAGDPTVRKALDDTRALAGTGTDPVQTLLAWIDEDRKAPPLKLLQGLVWESGYRRGAFRGQLFDEVEGVLRRWRVQHIPLFIYSSGSVQAQLLFFQYNQGGDLRDLFAGHFDTDVGPKVEAQSYRRILSMTGHQPGEMLFLSDNPRELVAAAEAGLVVLQAARESITPDGRFPAIHRFDEIVFDPVRGA